jgi:hypothetical protein
MADDRLLPPRTANDPRSITMFKHPLVPYQVRTAPAATFTAGQ